MQSQRSLALSLGAGGYPLTKLIIAINLVTMVLLTFGAPIGPWLAFVAPDSWVRPWTLLTYPLLSTDIIALLFNALLLYMFGGSLERGWGTRFYGIFFLIVTVVSALSIGLGSAVLHVAERAENWLPIAAVTITWCVQNSG